MDNLDAVAVADNLGRVVSELPRGVVPAVLGGDHSLTLGAVASLARQHDDLLVVQFDHHLDVQIWGGDQFDPLFNTNVMSHVASILGDGRCTQIGVGQFAAVERSQVDSVVDELRRVGTQIPLRQSISRAEVCSGVGTARPIYITFDVDVLVSTEMSSTSYPAPAGISVRDALDLIDVVLEGNFLVGCDIVEFSAPRESRDEKTLSDGARASLIFAHLISYALHRSTEGSA